MTATTQPKERPILFSGPMVRAILEGRKTQTRRVLKPQPASDVTHLQLWGSRPGFWHPMLGDPQDEQTWQFCGTPRERLETDFMVRCPFGAVGDRLWCRETLTRAPLPCILTGEPTAHEHAVYAADGEPCLVLEGDYHPQGFDLVPWWSGERLASTSMPRWASRLTLEVVSVRVERVNAISEADARAEGVELLPCSYVGKCNSNRCPRHGVLDPYRTAYRALWASLHGPDAWERGGWCWCVGFRRAEG